MPDHPHWYTVRGQTLEEDFEAFVVFIREHGYEAEFGNVRYTYFDVDGFSYWTMGAPLPETVIINRKQIV
jgi:hypothetical protein